MLLIISDYFVAQGRCGVYVCRVKSYTTGITMCPLVIQRYMEDIQ